MLIMSDSLSLSFSITALALPIYLLLALKPSSAKTSSNSVATHLQVRHPLSLQPVFYVTVPLGSRLLQTILLIFLLVFLIFFALPIRSSHRDMSSAHTARTEFNQHQRDVFCVFSGQGVHGLRKHLNAEARLQSTRELELDEDETTLREPSVGYGVINGHLNVGNMPGAFDDGEGDGDGDDAGDGEGDEELDDGGVTISPGEGQD
jgi:hypothetical protein